MDEDDIMDDEIEPIPDERAIEDEGEGDLSTASRLAAMGRVGVLDEDAAAFLLRLAREYRLGAPLDPWRAREARLDQRDELIRAYAATFLAVLPSTRAQADRLSADLMHEPSLPEPRPKQHQRVELRRISELSGGKALSAAHLRDILGGGRSR